VFPAAEIAAGLMHPSKHDSHFPWLFNSSETDNPLIVNPCSIYFSLGEPHAAQQDRLNPPDHKKGSQ
jgi:hypothetical protein